MIFFRHNKPGLSLSTILFFCTLALLFGCSEKTVNKASPIGIESSELTRLANKDETGNLAQKDPQTLVDTGWLYLSNNNDTLAKIHFGTALEKDPEMTEAYIGLAKVFQMQGNYAAAEASLQKALELQPDSVPAEVGLAQLARLQKKYSEAIEAINRAMAIAPDDINVLNELARIYEAQGQSNLAEPLFQEVMARKPDVAASHNNLGMNYMMQERYESALVEFHRALELEPESVKIRNNLATAYTLNGDEQTAFRLFKETVGDAAAYNNIGYLNMTQGKLDAAERAFNAALDANPVFYERAQENLDRVRQLRSSSGQL
jgi:Flp pilus assembly protein TadD